MYFGFLEIFGLKNFILIFVCIFKSFNDYFGQEHAKLLNLWRTVVSFRRSFGEMKSSTERDLHRLKSELNGSTRAMQGACFNLSANIKTNESQGQVSLARDLFLIRQ